MAEKIKGNNNGDSVGGGGGGGGREIMERNFSSGGNDPSFHKLLPNIAEAVDVLDVATIEEVQQKVEEETRVKYTKSELILGLENGRQLGLFELERQFKLNVKYLNELRSSKGDLSKITALVKKKIQEEKQTGMVTHFKRTGRMRTKSVRSKRSEKSSREEWSPVVLQKGDRLKVCDRRKKQISASSMESNLEMTPCDSESDLSVGSQPSHTKNPKKRSSLKAEGCESKRRKLPNSEEHRSRRAPQKKSKLLVERNNPLENEPYLDLFT